MTFETTFEGIEKREDFLNKKRHELHRLGLGELLELRKRLRELIPIVEKKIELGQKNQEEMSMKRLKWLLILQQKLDQYDIDINIQIKERSEEEEQYKGWEEQLLPISRSGSSKRPKFPMLTPTDKFDWISIVLKDKSWFPVETKAGGR